MNQAEFHIRTEHDGVLTLQQAVLIYRGAQGSAFATVHDVEEVAGEELVVRPERVLADRRHAALNGRRDGAGGREDEQEEEGEPPLGLHAR